MSLGKDQADKVWRCMRETCQLLRQRPENPMVIDLESPRWDVVVSVDHDDQHTCDVGVGIICGLLALALGHRIEPTTFFGGVRKPPTVACRVRLWFIRLGRDCRCMQAGCRRASSSGSVLR
jgi:hypothetical protein